jgi:integrase
MVFSIDNDAKFKMLLPKKYYAMYCIGVSSGLRISDIIKLEKSILDNKRPTITAQKTKKKKRIFINDKTMQLIREIVEEDKTGSKYIFPSPADSRLPISRQAVWKAFSSAAKKAGIQHPVGTHCMRKKYASKNYARNKNIFAVQKAMQHDNLSDTALYLIGAPKDDN